MDTLADYNAWKSKQQSHGVGAASVVLGAIDTTPDQAAGDFTLANEFGKVTGNPVPPQPMVREFRNVFQAAIAREKTKTTLSKAPVLTEWLRNPDNAAMASDDLDNLSWFEGLARGTGASAYRSGQRLGQAYNTYMLNQTAGRLRDRSMSFGDILDSERDVVHAKGYDLQLLPNISDIVSATGRYIDARYADLIGTDDEANARGYAEALQGNIDRMRGTPKSQIASDFEAKAMVGGASIGDTIKNFGTAILGNPIGALSWALETAGESLPQMAAGVATTAITRNPAAGIAVVGAGSYATERYTSVADFLAEKGIDLNKSEDVGRVLTDPALLKDANDRGVTRGLIVGAFDMLSAGMAGRVLVHNPMVEAVAQTAQQAISGMLGEYTARLAAGQPIDWADIIAEGMAEMATTPVDMGIAGRKLIGDRRAAKVADATAGTIAEIGAQAVASKTKARTPDVFRDYVARAAEGGAVGDLYVPAGEFVQYFQGLGVDPYAMIGELEGVTSDDLDVALAGGGDLAIPTATYAAKIAGSGHEQFFVENAKFDPLEMSAREAADFNERAQDAIQEAFDTAEAARLEDESLRSFEQQIYDDMVSRLRVAGRSTDVATTEATLYPAFYRVMAERSGMTINEFMRAYPLPQVRGDLPEGMQFRNIDALNRTLAEARARRTVGLDKRQTLLEFIADYGGINDPGGELRALDAEKIVVMKGKRRKTLNIARAGFVAGMRDMLGGKDGKKHGFDDVALAAIDDGFFANDPIAIEYKAAQEQGRQVPDIGAMLLDAIGRELAGEIQYAGDAVADPNADLDKIEAYLSSLGVSLNDSDDAIRAAIESDQAGAAYGQVSPEQARAIDMPVELPTDPLFAEAVTNTPGAKITEDGLLIDLVRYQKQEQAGSTSVRTGVFYLPAGSASAKHYKTGKNGYGGRVEVRGETLIKRPIFVKGATGGKAPEAAYDAIKGKGAYEKMRGDVLKAIMDRRMIDERGYNLLEEYGADGSLIWEIVPNSTQGNTLAYALQENIVAHAVRDAGYDAVLGYSVGRGDKGAFISEVFDVREIDYPTPGETATLHPNFAPAGRYLFQSGDVRGPRGLIQFPAGGIGNGDTIIRLFQGADLSTFVHESGHYFLTVLRDLAEKGETQAVADFVSVKDWWKANADAVAKDAMRVMPDVTFTADDVTAAIENGTTGDMMKDAAIDVGMQEQWARGFEAYLLEGKAPSAELRGAFEKFRAWLISVYRRVAGLNVAISDDLRNIFNRMLATDDEIAKASADAGDTGPLFASADEMGLSPDQYAAFLKLRSQAEDEAKARLLRETMAPVKRARDEWYKAERERTRGEVEKEVNAARYYRAIEWMGNRRWLGDGQPESLPDIRLSKDALVERYGEGVLKTLPRGKQTVYAVDGGIDPDDAAGWFGFDSGDELVQAMEKAPPRKEAIDAETDKLMRERHGDVLNDGTIEAEAMSAVHNDKRAQWLAAELKAVVEIAGSGVGMTAKEARASARGSIARMRVRDGINASRFLAAERKAAAEAAKLGATLAREKVWLDAAKRRLESQARKAAAGKAAPDTVATAIDAFNSKFETTQSTFTVNPQERVSAGGKQFTIPGGDRTATSLGYNDLVAALIQAKRRQLLNHALYMEAVKVADEVEKAERFVGKLGKKSMREKIAGAGRRDNAQIDYLGAIDDILERFDFRKLSGAAEQRRGALNAFVDAMKLAGRENELAIPDTVLTNASKRPYKTLPVEELRGVIDSLKNLEHVALRWNKLIDAQRERELDAVAGEIVGAFDANVKKRPPGRVGTRAEGLRNSARQFLDLVLSAGTILREIDGFADMGAAYRNIKSPIDEAMSRLISRKTKAAKDLQNLYAVYSKDERRSMARRDHIPELGYALSKWERIAVALNTGNAGNLQRLTDAKVRGSLTDAQVAAVLQTLDARDAAFIQSVWDFVGSFRDDIGARERRTTGIEPEWVEAQPVTVAGKTLKGGYYPLKYDPRLSALARDDEANDIAKSLQAGRFGKAQTRNGHTKERAQSSGRDVELDMSVLHRHINQVVYDLELSEAVANSWRILQDGRVRSAFMEGGKQADFDALEIWLKDIAEGELKSADLVGRGARILKSNFTAAKLAFNLSTVASQVAGLSQSMVVVGKKDFVRGLRAAFRTGAPAEIVAKSPYMETRQTTFNKDIFDFYNDPKTGPIASKWGEFKSDILGPLAFWMMTKVQWHLVDVPTWLAGYHQGLRRFGNDEAKAIAHADAIVKRAQASGLFPDRSAVERGSVSRTARQNDVVRLFTALGSYMFAKFNVAYERSAVAGRKIGQAGFSMQAAQEALSWTLDMGFLFTVEAVIIAAIKGRLPGEGDDGEDESWLKFLATETAFAGMGTVPFVRDVASVLSGFDGGGAYGAVTKDFAKPFIEATQGKFDAGFVKSVVNATGLVTGLPATQANRAIDAAWRQAEGKDVSPLEYLLGRFGK